MLDLTPQLSDLLLARLNERETTDEWALLLSSPEADRQRGQERVRLDTTFSDFHRALHGFVDEQLGLLRGQFTGLDRPAGVELLRRWLSCVDVFALWSKAPGDDEWLAGHVGTRPLSAFRVGASVFYLSGKGRARWRQRAWLGHEDPLMKLPYQRKYDFERHGGADEKLRLCHEKLLVCADLLSLVAERLSDIDVSDGFHWPELDDVQAELTELSLALSVDELLAFGGQFCLALCATTLDEDQPSAPKAEFTLAEGRYRGPLGGYHRRPSGQLRPSLSGASLKWMLGCALSELRCQVQQSAAGRAL